MSWPFPFVLPDSLKPSRQCSCCLTNTVFYIVCQVKAKKLDHLHHDTGCCLSRPTRTDGVTPNIIFRAHSTTIIWSRWINSIHHRSNARFPFSNVPKCKKFGFRGLVQHFFFVSDLKEYLHAKSLKGFLVVCFFLSVPIC